MRVDLHIHSNFSDGSHTPEDIAAIAKSRDVGLVAVCDHATAAGYDRLAKACGEAGSQCVLGIELSAQWRGECLTDAKACGIGGIEYYYPSHTKAVTDLCVAFCKRNGLRITGGCDCHGDFEQSEGFTIGSLDISMEMLDLKGII